MRFPIFLVGALSASAAYSQEWEWLPGMTSAKLAASQWELKAASSLVRPAGVTVLVSYWQAVIDGRRFTMQCFLEFGGSPTNTSPGFEMCMQPVGGEE
jgi:hypothetical protein